MPPFAARAARLLSIIGLLTIALACPLAALAQLPGLVPAKVGEGAPAQTSVTQATSPAPIPVSEIPSRISNDERFVEEVRLRATGVDPMERLVPALAAIEQSVDAKSRQWHGADLVHLPVMRLALHDWAIAWDRRSRTAWLGCAPWTGTMAGRAAGHRRCFAAWTRWRGGSCRSAM